MSTLAEQANALTKLRAGSVGLQMDMSDPAFIRRMNEASTMSAVAVRHGATPENEPFGMPEGMGNFFSTVADLFSRWEYGLAGFVDEIQGTGIGENPFERWTREVFSGVGGLKGEKETFGDILEQAGLPDVSLSQILTFKDRDWAFDPGLRGTIGLGIGIASDPAAWVGLPAGKLSQGLGYVVGTGQDAFVKVLSSKGQAFALDFMERQLDEAVKVMGISDHLGTDQILARMAKDEDLYRAVANDTFGKSTKLGGIGDAIDDGFVGAEQVRARMIDDIVQRIGDGDEAILKQMEKAGITAQDIWEKEGLRWRPFKIGKFDPLGIDVGLKVDLLAGRAYNKVLNSIENAVKAKFPDNKLLADGIEKYDRFHDFVNDLFFRNTRAARKDPWYMAREGRRFTMANGGKKRAEQFSKMLFQGVKNMGLKDEDERIFTTFFAEIVEGTAPSIKQVREFRAGLTQAYKMVDDPKDLEQVAEAMQNIGFDYVKSGEGLGVEIARMTYFDTNRGRFADMVKRLNNQTGKDQLNFNELVNKLRHTMKSIGSTEVRAGLLRGEQLTGAQMNMGKYFPRDHSKWSQAELDEFRNLERDPRIVRSTLGQYSEDRTARTFFGYAHAFYKNDAGHRVNWDLEEVIANRIKAHYVQMVNLDFLEDLSMRYGAKAALADNALVKGAIADTKISFAEMDEVDHIVEGIKNDDIEYITNMLSERLNDVGRLEGDSIDKVVDSVVNGLFPYKRQRTGEFAETIKLLRNGMIQRLKYVTEEHKKMAKWSNTLELRKAERGGLRTHMAKHGKAFMNGLADDMKSIEHIESLFDNPKRLQRFLTNLNNGRIATKHTGFINFLKRMHRTSVVKGGISDISNPQLKKNAEKILKEYNTIRNMGEAGEKQRQQFLSDFYKWVDSFNDPGMRIEADKLLSGGFTATREFVEGNLKSLTPEDLQKFGKLWIDQQRDGVFGRVKQLQETVEYLNKMTSANWAAQTGISLAENQLTWQKAVKEVFGKIDPESVSRRDRKLLERILKSTDQTEVNSILDNLELTKTGARGRSLHEHFRGVRKFLDEDLGSENATWAFNMMADDMAKAYKLLDEPSPLKGLKLQALIAEAIGYQYGLIDEIFNQRTLSVLREEMAGLSGLARKDAMAEMVKSGKLGTEPGTIFRRIFSEDTRNPMDFLKMREFQDRFNKMRPEQRKYLIQQLSREATTMADVEVVMNLSNRIVRGSAAKRITLEVQDLPELARGAVKGELKVNTANGILRMDLPPHLVEDVQKIMRHPLYPKEYAPIIEGIVWLNNIFKSSVTRYFPAFNNRNIGSNFIQSITDVGFAVLNPRYWRMAIAAVKGDDSLELMLKSGKRTHELRREMLAYGLIDNGDQWLELGETGAKKLPHDLPREFVEHLRKKYKGTRAEGALNLAHRAIGLPSFFEDFGRALHFIALADQGVPPAQAIARVNRFMFDYGDLSDFEKLVMKNLFPFYTWTRKNAEVFLRLLKEKPGAVNIQTKIFADPDRQGDSPSLPDYLRGDLPVRFHSRDNKVQFLGGIDIPIKNTSVLWAGGVGATFREHIGMLTPLIKNPVEFFYGKDTFGQPTRGHGRIPSRLGAAMERRYPEIMKKWLRFEKQTINGRDQYFADRTMLYMLNKSLFMSRMSSEGLKYDEMFAEFGEGNAEKGMVVLTKLLTGLSYREFDLDEAQRRTVYNNTSRLQKILDEKGLMRQFTTRYYSPQAKPPENNNPLGVGSIGPRAF